MPRYLSPEWIDAVRERVETSAAVIDGTSTLRVTQIVTGGPDGDVAYHFAVDGGSASLGAGAAAGEDVRLESDWDTAVAVATGALNAQDAFIQGRIRLRGDQSKLVASVDLFRSLDALVAELRPHTTYC